MTSRAGVSTKLALGTVIQPGILGARRGLLPVGIIAASLGVLGLLGCSGPSENAADTTGGEATASDRVSCSEDPRIDDYVAHLAKEGQLEVLAFEIVQSDPAPPFKGNNRFVVAVKDSSGTPFGSVLDVAVHMPDHGHDTSVAPVVSFDSLTRSYTVDPVYLFMAGVWRVELSARDIQGELVDQAQFYFCIRG